MELYDEWEVTFKNEPNEPNTISLGTISKDGYRLLEMIEHESSLTILQMAAILNVSRETVKRLLKKLKEGAYKRILFCATGAKLSTTSSQQGESIPGIAHAVVIERVK